MVFLEIKIKKKVTIHPKKLDPKQGHPFLRRAIFFQILHDMVDKRASKEHGYYVAVSTIESIGDGEVDGDSGNVAFPVTFKCYTAMYFEGEILIGTVDRCARTGLFMKAGSAENIFLSEKMMADYRYRRDQEEGVEGGAFVREEPSSKMEKGTKVRFEVLAVKWLEEDREFMLLATIIGDNLGPISV